MNHYNGFSNDKRTNMMLRAAKRKPTPVIAKKSTSTDEESTPGITGGSSSNNSNNMLNNNKSNSTQYSYKASSVDSKINNYYQNINSRYKNNNIEGNSNNTVNRRIANIHTNTSVTNHNSSSNTNIQNVNPSSTYTTKSDNPHSNNHHTSHKIMSKAEEKKILIVLVSNGVSDRRQASNQNYARMILKAKGIPHIEVDGMNPQHLESRNELFQISGIYAHYPQFFFVHENGSTSFLCDYEKFHELNETNTIPRDVLDQHPEIETWDKIFQNVVASFI